MRLGKGLVGRLGEVDRLLARLAGRSDQDGEVERVMSLLTDYRELLATIRSWDTGADIRQRLKKTRGVKGK